MKLNYSHITTDFDTDNMQSVYLEIEKIERTRTVVCVDVTKEHAEQLKDKRSFASFQMIKLLKQQESILADCDSDAVTLLDDCFDNTTIKSKTEYKMKHTDTNYDKNKVLFVDYDINELLFDEQTNTFDFVELSQEECM